MLTVSELMTNMLAKPSPFLPLCRPVLSRICCLYQLQIDSLDRVVANVYARDESSHCDKMIAKTDKRCPRMRFRLAVRQALHFLSASCTQNSFLYENRRMCVDCRKASQHEKQELCTSRGWSDPRSRLPRPSGALKDFMSASPMKAERLGRKKVKEGGRGGRSEGGGRRERLCAAANAAF